MKLNYSLALSTLALIVLFASSVLGARTFDAYRLVQYKNKAGVSFGSLHSGISLPAATLSAPSLKRHVLLLRGDDFCTDDATARIATLVDERKVEAMIIVLPAAGEPWAVQGCEAAWERVENFFVSRKFALPVYFIHDSDQASALLRDVVASEGGDSTAHHVLISLSDASQLREPKLVNLQGSLQPAAESLGTIAVVAHYDSLSIAPGLPVSGGTGAAALLRTARWLGELAHSRATPPKYRVIFVLTAAGHHNFAGAQQWLTASDAKLLESLSFALCIDEIDGPELYLHAARPVDGQPLLSELGSVAAVMGVQLNTVVRKPNASEPVMAWEHERFIRRKIASATVSSAVEATAPLTPQPLVPSAGVNTHAQRNARVIAEAVARFAYGVSGTGGLLFPTPSGDAGADEADDAFFNGWLNTLSISPRVAPYAADSSLQAGLEAALRRHVGDVFRQAFTLQSDIAFFGNEKAEMSVVRTQSASFDAFLLVPIVVYLVALTAILIGPKNAVSAITGTISSVLNRK